MSTPGSSAIVGAMGQYEDLVRHVLAANESIHHCLITSRSALDEDVVDDRRETRIANESETKRVPLEVAMRALAEADDLIGLEEVENRRDGL